MKTNYFQFFILVFLTIILFYFSKYVLNTDFLLQQSLMKNLSAAQIEKLFSIQKNFEWLNIIIFPIILLVKILLISAVLFLGISMFNFSIEFKRIIKVIISAEYLFLLVALSKMIWFVFFETKYTYLDIQYFYPLSALNLTGYKDIDPWFIYPLQVLNLFEIAYWFILAYLLGKELHISMDKGFKIVASSYGPALLIWVVAVMFLTLNLS